MIYSTPTLGLRFLQPDQPRTHLNGGNNNTHDLSWSQYDENFFSLWQCQLFSIYFRNWSFVCFWFFLLSFFFFLQMLLDKWTNKNWSMMNKNKKIKKRRKFKNFSYQFNYLITNFPGHLEKMSSVWNHSHLRPFLQHVHVLNIFS